MPSALISETALTHPENPQANAWPRRLAIVSHVVHYAWQDRLYAYEPYAREIDVWADLFAEVVIAAPLRRARPPGDAAPLAGANLDVDPQPEQGGRGLAAKLGLLLALPGMFWRLRRTLKRCDAVHVRCPGNLGLLGTLVAPMYAKRMIAKYAGQWSGYPGEAATVRLQRWLLRSRWWRGPVTVYGRWPDQPDHVIPFFTSIMDRRQVARARAAAANKRLDGPLRALYVGRLSQAKNVDALLLALAELKAEGRPFACDVVGDGPMRRELEQVSAAHGLTDSVVFHGAVGFERVLEFYERADILALVSETEGWPKAIMEAMIFGLVCIGSNRGLVPWLLEARGLTVEAGDAKGLADALRDVDSRRDFWRERTAASAAWARQYSLEGLRDALRDLMAERWGVAPAKEPGP